MVVEINTSLEKLDSRQRLATVLTAVLAVVGIWIAINLRESSLNAVETYTNIPAGITSSYPRGWLLDTDGDYIFRVRDMTRSGFKTTIQVSVRPVSEDTSEYNILNSLTMNRAQVLSNYRGNPVGSFTLPDETIATATTYSFVSRDASPFLESSPVVVRGLDLLTIQRGQAIIITFQADTAAYESELRRFEQFLAALDF